MDIAASIQEVTEEIMLMIARHIRQKTGMKNLCMAGGVALNCVGNGKILKEKGHGKYLLDLWAANALIFAEAGILAEHISYPGICTCCNPQFLFSHRASKGKRGNLGAFLGLREFN